MSSEDANTSAFNDTAKSPYVCPGETTPVSRAVHLARVHTAWRGCDRCQWRDDAEGLAETSKDTLTKIRANRAVGIRRTEFGVRGVWQNQIDRTVASRLIRIFCDALIRNCTPADKDQPHRGHSQPDSEVEPQRISLRPLVAGFDGRTPSLDLFVGVASAIRESGFPILDIGRCTASSLLEATRALGDVQAGVIVTGSGTSSAETGFDVLDPAGDPIAVHWKDYGIRVTTVEVAEDAVSKSAARVINCLQNTATAEGPALRRVSRHFGPHQQVAFEDRYRESLLRWFPRRSRFGMVMHCQDDLLQSRIEWLARKCELKLTCIRKSVFESPATGSTRIEIFDDDRQFIVFGRSGQPISATSLADRINASIRSGASQITAHADSATNRFWLTDAARPGSQFSSEHITDALATAGLILRLCDAGLSLA